MLTMSTVWESSIYDQLEGSLGTNVTVELITFLFPGLPDFLSGDDLFLVLPLQRLVGPTTDHSFLTVNIHENNTC